MSPDSTTPYFTVADILEKPQIRQEFLKDFAVSVRSYAQYFGHLKEYIALDKKVLHEAFASAYCDMYRLTTFRGIENADVHKKSAFLVKWIAKMRPIRINRYISASIIGVNESFAITIALTLMNISPERFHGSQHLGKYIQNLMYLLHYHDCAPEQLASELFLLEMQIVNVL
ncbi:MAG: hypothetical protein LBI05_11485 [Planctomycetaceae bacterium]|jgi:hypothetical protein|nr:hypothetical protein [Planctomycetaceae bacterium]